MTTQAEPEHRRPKRHVDIDTAVMLRRRQELGAGPPLSFRTLARLVAIESRGKYGVTSARLGQIQRGDGSPSPELFRCLARALGIDENELRLGDG